MAYATWNPSDKHADITLSNGDLTATNAGAWRSVRATQGKTAGKYYFEITVTDGTYTAIGFADSSAVLTAYPGIVAESAGFIGHVGFQETGNIFTIVGSSVAYTDGDIISAAIDLDAGKLWFGKNNTWAGSGDPAGGTNPSFTFTTGTALFPMVGPQTSNCTANFGASAFTYSVPAGFNSGWYSGSAEVLGEFTDTLTLTDTIDAYAPIADPISETLTLTDTADALHLVDIVAETLTITDTAEQITEYQGIIVESATLTDEADPLHLVDLTSETATLTDTTTPDELIRRKLAFPNLSGKHLTLVFSNTSDQTMGLLYSRFKLFKTLDRNDYDTLHPNLAGNHLSLKFSNDSDAAFLLEYTSMGMFQYRE